MSRLQSSSSHAQLNYKPALTVLLRAQDEADYAQRFGNSPVRQVSGPMTNPTQLQSPYRSKQAIKGLGRNAKPTPASLERKSAKGLLKSLSAASLPPPGRQLEPLQQQPQQATPTQFNRQQPLRNPATDMWQADPSKPPSAANNRPQSGLGILSGPGIVPAKAGESAESQAFRSLPAHSFAHSHYYQQAEPRPTRVIHVHQYPDGSVVEECTCERGAKLVEAEQRASKPQPAQQQPPRQQQEEKESNNPPPPQPTSPIRSPVKSIPPSQIARAEIAYAKQQRPQDTSRQHSVYASNFQNHKIEKFSKLGKGYFASHNKSYIRSCLQDPGYGFTLDQLKAQPQHLNYALEITREHKEPEKSLRAIIPPQNWPNTTHHSDFAAPSPELIRSYKRVGKDYRQAGNKSYIRYNLVDPDYFKTGPGATDPKAAIANANFVSSASSQIHVPFTADTIHHGSFLDFSAQYKDIRGQAKAKVIFGGESRPEENIWQQWDDNYVDPNDS